MEKRIRITLVRSLSGRPDRQRRTVAALGLRRRGQSVEKQENPQILGMVNQVKHLVAVAEGSTS